MNFIIAHPHIRHSARELNIKSFPYNQPNLKQ